MSTRARWENGIQIFYDDSNFETVRPMAPVVFEDDFLGKGLQTTDIWTAIDVSVAGNTTPLLAADVGGGVARFPLDATSEAQESGFTFGDQRTFVPNRGLVFECRLALQTLPTGLAIAVFGLASDKNAVADSVVESVWFRAEASGAIVVESDDNTTNVDDVASGTTLTAGTFAIFTIDFQDPAAVKFFINGNRVAPATTFNAGATTALQPYFHLAKASGTGVGTVDCDYVRLWQKRS